MKEEMMLDDFLTPCFRSLESGIDSGPGGFAASEPEQS
jgi:hypothetical protein